MTAVEVVKNFFLSEVPSEVTTVVNEWVNKLLGEALHYEVRPGQHQASAVMLVFTVSDLHFIMMLL